MPRWLDRLRGGSRRQRDIPDRLWQRTLANFPFLAAPGDAQDHALRKMTRQFLDEKEFDGAGGLVISDEIAVPIAAQACLPVLHLDAPYRGIDWYADFVGIVVHQGPVRARREIVDDAGVVHQFDEELTGEAMQDGPVTLSWQDVRSAGSTARDGYNVVIHEFVHKIDMRNGPADGCPPLPPGFMGAATPSKARSLWRGTLDSHYQDFCDKCSIAERFGGAPPWLDPYGCTSTSEFFAVASEAYFVNREFFGRDFPVLLPLFDAFFRPSRVAG